MATFALMMNRFKTINFFFGLAVLFSMLFQSLHSIEHLAKQLSGESCFHKYSDKATLNHSHYWEKCHVCEYAFSNYTETKFADFTLESYSVYFKTSTYHNSDFIPFYSGSSFSLRGPPIV